MYLSYRRKFIENAVLNQEIRTEVVKVRTFRTFSFIIALNRVLTIRQHIPTNKDYPPHSQTPRWPPAVRE